MIITQDRPVSGRSRKTTVAWIITEALGPVVQIVALLLIVGVHESSSVWQGLAYGAIAAVFAGLIPYAIVLTGVRLGRLGDRHVYERAERPAMMLLALCSVTFGLWFMHTLDAPRGLFALVAAMVAGLATTLTITLWWKISIHTAVAAGSAVTLSTNFGPWGLAWLPVVVLIAWSRVATGAHTPRQTVIGAMIGACATVVVTAAMT
jgi:membrane-associated phospholipid phosphatase